MKARARLMRLRLRRADGRTYLRRWGVEISRPNIGGIYLHRMDAPDPGLDLHDHPFAFVSLILKGGYIEERADVRDAASRALRCVFDPSLRRGTQAYRRAGRAHLFRLDECHTITHLIGSPTWTLVIRGPRRRGWGFYLPSGYMDERTYDRTVRIDRRDLFDPAVEQAIADSEGLAS